MAAAIIIAAQRSQTSLAAEENEEIARNANVDAFDADRDGRISLAELKANLRAVSLRADVLQQRLSLEVRLTDMAIKMPNFLLCLICFLLAIVELSPPVKLSSIHKHLEDHFTLRDITSIKDTQGIYEYMAFFETQNSKMNPTSAKYWCEHRYATYRWDDEAGVPVMECESPRLGALGLSETRWSELNSVNGTSSASSRRARMKASAAARRTKIKTHRQASAASSALPSASVTSSGLSGGGHRRLAGSGSGASGEATHPVPLCRDDDAGLRSAEANPNISCNISANHVCDIDIGILYCPKTCGYCSPFTYDHVLRFDKPQVTMLPAVLYQSRFVEAPCHGFAHDFENQNYNPALTLLPALDGQRNGRLLTCVDRSKQLESAYALELDCPANAPPTKCVDGKVRITPKHTFHGTTIYPVLLIDPQKELKAMQNVEWIDVQTDAVSVSTMVYTEGLEIFTSLTVTFSLDMAGNVEGSIKMSSYRDLIAESKTWFSACLIITCCGAFLGVVFIVYKLVRAPNECDGGLVLYEVCSRAVLFAYPLVLLVSWTQQAPMAHEYQLLLDTALNADGMDEESQQRAMEEYFSVKDHMYHEVSWLENHRTAAYIVCYVQFVQVILYFSAHPAMAMLTSTVKKCLSNMMHFFMLFSVLFVMLAFMAHWLLGGVLHDFATFPDALNSQTQMLYGDFLVADGVEFLTGNLSVMYWVYAITFLLVAILTLLNFFLAIVVDAFVAVRADNEQLEGVVGTFVTDLVSLPQAFFLRLRLRIPPTKRLVAFFNEVCERHKQEHREQHMVKGLHRVSVAHGVSPEVSHPFCRPAHILQRFEKDGLTMDSLCKWLIHMQRRTKDNTIYFNDADDEDAGMAHPDSDNFDAETIGKREFAAEAGNDAERLGNIIICDQNDHKDTTIYLNAADDEEAGMAHPVSDNFDAETLGNMEFAGIICDSSEETIEYFV